MRGIVGDADGSCKAISTAGGETGREALGAADEDDGDSADDASRPGGDGGIINDARAGDDEPVTVSAGSEPVEDSAAAADSLACG